MAGKCAEQLEDMLKRKNGFYAFESALHVFPLNGDESKISIEKWNSNGLWKDEYNGNLENITFYAEDLFAGQFGIQENKIVRFDPEVGEINTFSGDLVEWAEKILDDYDCETGYPLATDWQKRNGILQPGFRLLPKIPFVLGGEYEVENLYATEAVAGMYLRADIWRQIKDLPDGTDIELQVDD